MMTVEERGEEKGTDRCRRKVRSHWGLAIVEFGERHQQPV